MNNCTEIIMVEGVEMTVEFQYDPIFRGDLEIGNRVNGIVRLMAGQEDLTGLIDYLESPILEELGAQQWTV